jgi:CMP-N-acetylneuraminic acid synthetase
MKFFIIIKKDSKRIPNKNFKLLGEFPLWEHLIKELKDEDVYIDTDSEKLLLDCKKYSYIKAYPREQKFIDYENDSSINLSPALMMIENFLDHHVRDENEVIITPHVTSPFIKKQTIIDASLKLNEGYDSVQACVNHKEFCYFKGQPVNFNSVVIQKTQELEPVQMGNGAFFIFTKKIFKRYKNRTGQNPYFYPIEYPESIEIDNLEDLEVAEAYYGRKHRNN